MLGWRVSRSSTTRSSQTEVSILSVSVKDETRRVNLTSREGQVVALRAMERGFDVIAEQLGISEAMVRRVYARARRKIDRKTR